MGTRSGLTWGIAGARRAGQGKTVCQDAYAWDWAGGTIVAAVSDGAGSAVHGALGAKFVAETAVAKACELVLRFGSDRDIPAESLTALIPDLRKWLKLQAFSMEAKPEDLAATLTLAIAGPRGLSVVQIGDGACVALRADGSLNVVCWPDQGEYANATYFVTGDEAESHTQTARLDEPVDAFALFSDGLLYLLLDPATQSAHAPFFEKVFGALEGQSGDSVEVGAWLDEMLASPQVTARTDDDTTIVVARRTSGQGQSGRPLIGEAASG